MTRTHYILLAMSVCTMAGCRTARVVTVQNSETHRPVSGATVRFFPHGLLEDYVAGAVPNAITVDLDADGQGTVRLPKRRTWVTYDLGTNSPGTSLQESNIVDGGSFRLFSPHPFSDTNLYPSKYVLEIRKP